MAQSTTMHTMTLDRPASAASAGSTSKRAVRRERVEFGALLGLCFTILLPVIVGRRALASLGLVAPAGGPAQSVLKEARAAARSTIPYAFMG
jgi:hypothetical protein